MCVVLHRTIVLCSHMQLLAKELYQPKLSEKDFADIRKVAKSKNVFEQLSESIAPSIYGHDYIKKVRTAAARRVSFSSGHQRMWSQCGVVFAGAVAHAARWS